MKYVNKLKNCFDLVNKMKKAKKSKSLAKSRAGRILKMYHKSTAGKTLRKC